MAAKAGEKYSINEAEHRETLLEDLVALKRFPQRLLNLVRRHGLSWHGPNQFGSGECRESLAD
jgi:hypothetical protein